MINEKGYDYVCVSRSSLKNYNVEAGATRYSYRLEGNCSNDEYPKSCNNDGSELP